MDFLGIAYVERGRDPAVGLDCWGLVREWHRVHRGIWLPSLLDAPAYVPDHLPEQRLAWTRVAEPEPGDLVVISLADQPWHVGVFEGLCGGVPTMLHTSRRTGVVRVDLRDPAYAPRIEGYYRHG